MTILSGVVLAAALGIAQAQGAGESNRRVDAEWAATRDTIASIQDEQVKELLVAEHGAVEGHRLAFIQAKITLEKANEAIALIERRVANLRALREKLDIKEQDTLLESEEVALKTLVSARDKLQEDLDTKETRYRGEATRLQAFVARAMPRAKTEVAAIASVDLVKVRADTKYAPCSLDTPEERLLLDPNKCRWSAEDASQHVPRVGLEATSLSLAGRVLDRRGVTTQLTFAGSTSTATVTLADSFNVRGVPNEESRGPFFQDVWTWGYSLGVQANLKDGRARIGGIVQDEEDNISALDRIDSSLKLTGSIGFNFFAEENEASFARRSKALHSKALVDCRADQAKPSPGYISTCTGDQLIQWIFAAKLGGYANPDMVKAFNEVYWAPAERVARAGFGVTGEVARPQFDYFPFSMTTVADPLRSGETKTIVDLSALPQRFLDDEPIRQRRLAYSFGLYGFFHVPLVNPEESDQYGITTIVSATRKREYKKADDITICPAATGPFTTSELCRTVLAADPKPRHSWVPAAEFRTLLPGLRPVGRWLPAVGFAPKISYEFLDDSPDDRFSIDVPVWVGLDDKQNLSGGIAANWKTGGEKTNGDKRDDEWIVSIFLGTTLSLGSK